MKEFKGCKNYTLLGREDLEDINSSAYTLVHDKTGAKIVLLANSDENKCFIIGFKTPPKDSTGVPHILEHSVLCGSEKYPVKDAMTEVGKGSLNTFLNAFTYPDRTLYPVASCNDKDFQNLMSVYLDAVFYPRVLKEKKIFMQEGWHYELSDANADIKLNGVVYNEMKGVFSSPEGAMGTYTLESLFPDTQYGVCSGGNPDVIPNLSYEDFCNFHKKLYHPSNARIYLYGDMDFEEKLRYIDEEYLSKFERLETDSEVILQRPFDKRVRVVKEYSVLDTDEIKDATFLSYNVVCSDFRDLKTNEAMNVINYALCSVPGSKLEKRLIDSGICKNVYSDFATDTCQKIFSIVAQGANPEDEERFVSIVEDTMREIIEEGFDRQTLEASITSDEFSYREADFGYFPKGIAYGTLTFEEWLYSDDNIFSALKECEVYKELRNEIENGLFEKVLKECVLENEHKSILVMKPVRGLSKIRDEELSGKLSAYKDTLSKEEIESIIKNTAELKQYQEEPDSEEALATIPTLSLKDIKKEAVKTIFTEKSFEGINEIITDVSSNGIAYFSLSFDCSKLPKRLIPALSVLKTLFCSLDTESYSYGQLANEINIKSGGISTYTTVYRNRFDADDYKLRFEVRARAFYDRLPDTFELIRQILFTSALSDSKRVKENLEQSKVNIQSYMISSGHAVAIGRAGSGVSEAAALTDMLSGMRQYRFIESVTDDFDNSFDTLLSQMEEVISILVCRDNLEVNLGCENKAVDLFNKALKTFIESIPVSCKSKETLSVSKASGNEAYSCASMVQYVALFGNYSKTAGIKYDGSLSVLKTILNTDYLWTEVRLKGGAYGCMCNFTTTGEVYFVSYRDPKLKDTIDTYNRMTDYIASFPDDDESVERYIISTIGEYDSPLTPSQKTSRSFNMHMSGATNDDKQRERDEILSTTPNKIRNLVPFVQAVLDEGVYSAVGGEEILKKEGNVFDKINPLYNGQE